MVGLCFYYNYFVIVIIGAYYNFNIKRHFKKWYHHWRRRWRAEKIRGYKRRGAEEEEKRRRNRRIRGE